MTERYVWRVFCPLEGQYVTTVSDIEPTVCPNDNVTPVDPNLTAIMKSIFVDIVTDGYINIESHLADNQALKIHASDANGGIDIDAGFGGITIDTTNAVSIDASAASNFTTTVGNLDLQATVGLVNINGGSGINVGNDATTTPILIGTSANSKVINIGNNTGTTAVAINSGTGLITLNSADTSTGAITAFSSGGIDVDATGVINLSSADNTTNAITLDASFNNGGVVLSSGTQGIFLSSNGGPLALGSFSGGDVFVGTAAISRTVTIGNTTGTSAVNIDSGTGGIIIGNNANGGEIQIGNVANDKTVIVGNSTGGSRLFTRFGAGGLIKHQDLHTSLGDTDATITIGDILKQLFTITPTIDRTLTLPTATLAVAGIPGVQVNDAIDFTIINNSSAVDEADVIVAPGLAGTIEGNGDIAPRQNNAGTFYTSGSGTFRLRFTNVTGGTEAYTVYRLY